MMEPSRPRSPARPRPRTDGTRRLRASEDEDEEENEKDLVSPVNPDPSDKRGVRGIEQHGAGWQIARTMANYYSDPLRPARPGRINAQVQPTRTYHGESLTPDYSAWMPGLGEYDRLQRNRAMGVPVGQYGPAFPSVPRSAPAGSSGSAPSSIGNGARGFFPGVSNFGVGNQPAPQPPSPSHGATSWLGNVPQRMPGSTPGSMPNNPPPTPAQPVLPVSPKLPSYLLSKDNVGNARFTNGSRIVTGADGSKTLLVRDGSGSAVFGTPPSQGTDQDDPGDLDARAMHGAAMFPSRPRYTRDQLAKMDAASLAALALWPRGPELRRQRLMNPASLSKRVLTSAASVSPRENNAAHGQTLAARALRPRFGPGASSSTSPLLMRSGPHSAAELAKLDPASIAALALQPRGPLMKQKWQQQARKMAFSQRHSGLNAATFMGTSDPNAQVPDHIASPGISFPGTPPPSLPDPSFTTDPNSDLQPTASSPTAFDRTEKNLANTSPFLGNGTPDTDLKVDPHSPLQPTPLPAPSSTDSPKPPVNPLHLPTEGDPETPLSPEQQERANLWEEVSKGTDDLVNTGNRLKAGLGPQPDIHYLDQRTLDKIRVMSPHIKKYSEFFNVDPSAVALPMAWEYNTWFHQDPGTSRIGNLAKSLGWDGFEDAMAERGARLRFSTDLGPANVNVKTAERLLQEYHDMINKSGILKNDSTLFSKYGGKLVPWLISDEGNAFVSALVVHDAQKKHPYILDGLDRDDRIGHLYNLFREGDKYGQKWLNKVETNATQWKRPGEQKTAFAPQEAKDMVGAIKTGNRSSSTLPAQIRPRSPGLSDLSRRVQEIDRVLD